MQRSVRGTRIEPREDSEEEPQSILEDFGADATRAQLAEFIAGLNEDEQANLVALTWVGRGTYRQRSSMRLSKWPKQSALTPRRITC